MSRMVFCRKYQQTMPGLAQPPFPGAKGQAIFDAVSEAAWKEWLAHQTTLINEKRLNVMQPETRAYLDEQREKFLDNADVEQAEGFQQKPGNS